MADYISSYSGTQIDSLLGQIKNEGQIQNMIDASQTVTQATDVSAKGITASIWKCGKIGNVTINGQLSSALASGATLFTLPAGYRPKVWQLIHGPNTLFVILTNGNVYSTAALASGSWVQFSSTYILL